MQKRCLGIPASTFVVQTATLPGLVPWPSGDAKSGSRLTLLKMTFDAPYQCYVQCSSLNIYSGITLLFIFLNSMVLFCET